MSVPTPSNWLSGLTRLATTALVVAVALYVAVHLIEAVAPVLLVVAAVGSVIYSAVLVARYRRSRW
jgi:hypothetical protein